MILTFLILVSFILMRMILYCLLSVFSNSWTTADPSATVLTEFTYQYERKLRKVPLKLFYPTDRKATNLPVIIMSHGLGGSREMGTYLGKYWSEKGFVVIAMQHEGSDGEIFKGLPKKEYVKAMKRAMSAESWLKRMHDVPATIDKIAQWNTERDHLLFGKVNMKQLGMCGHSFGAITTLSASGQWNALVGQKFTDRRIKAAFAMSPSTPRKRGKPDMDATKKAFARVTIPWLLMTGTKDTVFLTPQVTVESRKQVYAHLPAGDKYQLVLDGANHMAFSDRTLLGKKQRNPNHHKAIQQISLAFFQAYLKGDEKAKIWLKEDVRQVLDDKDSWDGK